MCSEAAFVRRPSKCPAAACLHAHRSLPQSPLLGKQKLFGLPGFADLIEAGFVTKTALHCRRTIPIGRCL